MWSLVSMILRILQSLQLALALVALVAVGCAYWEQSPYLLATGVAVGRTESQKGKRIAQWSISWVVLVAGNEWRCDTAVVADGTSHSVAT